MFEKIDIGIKTFLRDDKLFHAIQGITSNFPGARLVIVDDGDQTEEKDSIYADLTRKGHVTDVLPFDSGFGMKSNRIVELSTRPYLLIASDDFEFDEKAASGLSELQQVLDLDSSVDIASGRVDKRYYEFFLKIVEYPEGISIHETPVFHPHRTPYYPTQHALATAAKSHEIITPWYIDCDLTVNYSLMRRSVFDRVKWDDDVKIGNGEHGAFFYDCKLAGLRTVCVEGVNINEQTNKNSSRYQTYRNRANGPERKCFDNREIFEYILGDGRVDYRRL